MIDIQSLFQYGGNERVLVVGKTTINISDNQKDVDVLFERDGRRFMMLFSGLSEATINAKEYLFGKNINMHFINDDGQPYIAYDCLFLKSKMTMNYILMEGEYKSLLRGSYIPNCGILKLHFDGIEVFMGNCDVTSEKYLDEYNKWCLFEENEKRMIAVRLKDIGSYQILHNLLVRVREYFEFIANHQLIFDEINFCGFDGKGIEILRSDKISTEKSYVFHDKTTLSTDVIFGDLCKWLLNYEKYKEPIYIWKKSIYNFDVSEEDVFLWRCQAFELLCELDNKLYREAIKLKDERQKEPNLRNYLEALNQVHHYINCQDDDFRDVKEVRNLYTHNNPKKMVSQRQWHNSTHLIQLALIEGIKYTFGMENKDCKAFYLHIAKHGMEKEKKRFNV